MDTKYWGPPGWKMLHLISFGSTAKKDCLYNFFSSLPFVLPCKYCRASLSEYMTKISLEDALESDAPNALGRWLWKIHNCVNDKLRKQHIKTAPDPPFIDVKTVYLDNMKRGCTKTIFEGWEFLFSIVENHPYSRQSLTGKPITGCPEPDALKMANALEKNRWNALSPEERMPYVLQFWAALPKVLPFKEWTTIWEKCPTDWSSRKSSLSTLWKIRCTMESELKLLNTTDYSSLCKELQTYRSGCNKSKRAITCRKKRPVKSESNGS